MIMLSLWIPDKLLGLLLLCFRVRTGLYFGARFERVVLVSVEEVELCY